MGTGFRSGNGHIQPWKLPVSFNEFHGWIWPFPNLKPDPINQEWYSLCPQWGILMGQFVSTGFWGHWILRGGKKVKKPSKNQFSVNFHGWIWPFPDLKPDPIGQKRYSLCPWWDILMCKFIYTGFWGHWVQRMGKNWKQIPKKWFFRHSWSLRASKKLI